MLNTLEIENYYQIAQHNEQPYYAYGTFELALRFSDALDCINDCDVNCYHVYELDESEVPEGIENEIILLEEVDWSEPLFGMPWEEGKKYMD